MTDRPYVSIKIYRAMPLSIDEVLSIVDRIEPQEAFIVNKLNEKLFGDKFYTGEDVSEDVTGQVQVSQELLDECVSTQEDVSPELKTDGSFFGDPKKKELPTELILDAREPQEGKTLVETIHNAVPGYGALMSSLDLVYGYDACSEKKQMHYIRVKLVTRFDPRREHKPEDAAVMIQQMPFGLLLTCDRLDYEPMLNHADKVLWELSQGRSKRGLSVKSESPGTNEKPVMLARLDALRATYCRK